MEKHIIKIYTFHQELSKHCGHKITAKQQAMYETLVKFLSSLGKVEMEMIYKEK